MVHSIHVQAANRDRCRPVGSRGNRTNPAPITVVVISVSASSRMCSQCRRAGAAANMAKPCRTVPGLKELRAPKACGDTTNCCRANLLQRLQLLPGFEPHRLPGRNGYLRTGARIPPDAGLAGRTLKTPKPRSSIRSPCARGFLHRLENSFDGHLGLGLGDPGPVYNLVDDVQLDQQRLLRFGPSEPGQQPGIRGLLPAIKGQPYDRIEFIGMSSNVVGAEAGYMDKKEFCRACARFATGVAVATVLDAAASRTA